MACKDRSEDDWFTEDFLFSKKVGPTILQESLIERAFYLLFSPSRTANSFLDQEHEHQKTFGKSSLEQVEL